MVKKFVVATFLAASLLITGCTATVRTPSVTAHVDPTPDCYTRCNRWGYCRTVCR
jgi:hypothetical protein